MLAKAVGNDVAIAGAELVEKQDFGAEDLAGRLPLAVTANETSVHGQIDIVKVAAEVKADWVILQPPPIRTCTSPFTTPMPVKSISAARRVVRLSATRLVSSSVRSAAAPSSTI